MKISGSNFAEPRTVGQQPSAGDICAARHGGAQSGSCRRCGLCQPVRYARPFRAAHRVAGKPECSVGRDDRSVHLRHVPRGTSSAEISATVPSTHSTSTPANRPVNCRTPKATSSPTLRCGNCYSTRAGRQSQHAGHPRRAEQRAPRLVRRHHRDQHTTARYGGLLAIRESHDFCRPAGHLYAFRYGARRI